MGSSEVGHLTLGAGAVVSQTLTVINEAVSDGQLATNDVVRMALRASERVHLLGMVSDGGVHSGLEHLRALIALAAELEVPDLVLHCFTDGRNTPPTAREGYLRTLSEWCRGGITADHGNAEQMVEPDGGPSTFHSLKPVPLIVTARGVALSPEGTLADVAPTVLALLRMEPSPRMDGHSLLGGSSE